MPWKESCAVALREKLVSTILTRDAAVSEMCQGCRPVSRWDAEARLAATRGTGSFVRAVQGLGRGQGHRPRPAGLGFVFGAGSPRRVRHDSSAPLGRDDVRDGGAERRIGYHGLHDAQSGVAPPLPAWLQPGVPLGREGVRRGRDAERPGVDEGPGWASASRCGATSLQAPKRVTCPLSPRGWLARGGHWR